MCYTTVLRHFNETFDKKRTPECRIRSVFGTIFSNIFFEMFLSFNKSKFFASLPPKCFIYPHQNTTSEWLSTLGHSRIARAYLAHNRRITWLSRFFFLEKSSKTFESSINYFNESKFLSVSYMICTDFFFLWSIENNEWSLLFPLYRFCIQ